MVVQHYGKLFRKASQRKPQSFPKNCFKPKIPPCLEQDGIFKILTDCD
jgi:hypothetical protein